MNRRKPLYLEVGLIIDLRGSGRLVSRSLTVLLPDLGLAYGDLDFAADRPKAPFQEKENPRLRPTVPPADDRAIDPPAQVVKVDLWMVPIRAWKSGARR